MGPLRAVKDAVEPMEETSTIKLSICIPTLNRGSFIGETLESILLQATDEVEIVIVDGGSTDSTQDVVRQYQQRFPNLRYVREYPEQRGLDSPSPSNGGFDRDCIRAVELAKGEYCWLFTDDDILKPGAIQTVLEAIGQSYGLVIVNSEVRNADLSDVLEPRRLRMSGDRIYKITENQILLADVGSYLSFVGGVVIKRQLWIARRKEKYVGTGFIHIGVVFQRPIPEDTLVIAEPLISIRYGNALYGNSGRYFEIWMFNWPQLIWSFPHYADWAKRRVCLEEPWRRTRALLLLRAKGAFSLKQNSDWLEPRLRSGWSRLEARLIARFPGCILNLLAFIYCWTILRRSKLELLDLVNSPFYFWNSVKQFLSRSKRNVSWINLHGVDIREERK